MSELLFQGRYARTNFFDNYHESSCTESDYFNQIEKYIDDHHNRLNRIEIYYKIQQKVREEFFDLLKKEVPYFYPQKRDGVFMAELRMKNKPLGVHTNSLDPHNELDSELFNTIENFIQDQEDRITLIECILNGQKVEKLPDSLKKVLKKELESMLLEVKSEIIKEHVNKERCGR